MASILRIHGTGAAAALGLFLSALATVANLTLAVLVSWLLPPSRWDPLLRRAVAAERRVASGPFLQRIELIRETGGPQLAARAEAIAIGSEVNRRLKQCHYLASYRSEGWPERLAIDGLEHLHAALARGHGAVLWFMPFVFTPLLAKRTLAEAGIAIHHLSRPGHGLSLNRFGELMLRQQNRIEQRYLAEHIIIPERGMPAWASRRLLSLVRANQVVSITLFALGAQVVRVAVLNDELDFATGAPNLAVRQGAALLPVLTVRTAPPAQFTTVIEAPLKVAPNLKREDAIASLARAMAGRVEVYAQRWPDQYRWSRDLN